MTIITPAIPQISKKAVDNFKLIETVLGQSEKTILPC